MCLVHHNNIIGCRECNYLVCTQFIGLAAREQVAGGPLVLIVIYKSNEILQISF